MQICCSFVFSLYSIWGDLVGVSASPGHTCRVGSSLWWIWNLCTLSLYLSLSLILSHTLFSQRCCAVSHAGKVPFPSISGRLQRSVIREINGPGPISCFVPFESAKLLRTSKKMSQFIWDLLSLIVQMSNTYNQSPCVHTHTQISNLHIHTCIHMKADQQHSKYDPKHDYNALSVNDVMVLYG